MTSDQSGLELRPTGQQGCFDLYEGDERIGEIEYFRYGDGDAHEYWSVEIWSLMGTGKKWSADAIDSDEEAVRFAHELYGEFVAERRELKRPVPGMRVISTPMGGQKRRP